MYVFGYGSLMNVLSAQEDISRQIDQSNMIPSILTGYKRTWSLKARIFSNNLGREVSAVFLNINQSVGIHMNGVLIEIDESDLDLLKIREKNYNCVEVGKSVFVIGQEQKTEKKVYTFIAQENHKITDRDTEIYIMRKYKEKVEAACLLFGEQFLSNYFATTDSPHFPILDGDYSFVTN